MTGEGWAAVGGDDEAALREFLRPIEWGCVSVTSHLAARDYELVEVHRSGDVVTEAVMLAPHGLLLPVLSPEAPSLPRGILALLPPTLTVMGEERSVSFTEGRIGRSPDRAVSYHLMRLPAPFGPAALEPPAASIPELRVRRASPADLAALYPLQRDYEMEEVLLDPGAHSPRLCRAGLRRALRDQIVFMAEAEGRPIAKAGTNARGAGYDQIGGVYTVPELRGRGAGRAVMAQLLARIGAEGKGASLFVKRSNDPAVALYRRLGFEPAGGFRISYYFR